MRNFWRALPAYLGGKRRLARAIFALLTRRLPSSDWRDLTFVDPFLGGGSISLLAKAYGFEVHCNDVAYRSALVGHALIANSRITLSDKAPTAGPAPWAKSQKRTLRGDRHERDNATSPGS